MTAAVAAVGEQAWGRSAFTMLAALGMLLAALLGSPMPAQAQSAPQAPTNAMGIPAGYTTTVDGPARWTYPSRAESEVEQLRQRADEAWPELSAALGTPLGGSLDIRVATNPTEMSQLAPTGVRLPGYASGVAFPARGLVLLTMTAPGSWRRPNMASVLVHELSHVALHRAVGGTPVPRWFSEGTAIHHAGENSVERIRSLWEGALSRQLLPLSALNTGFSSNHHGVDLAYAQSADVVRFLLETDEGEAKFRSLVRTLREGVPFEQAIEQAYNRSLSQLERNWRVELSQRFGRWPLVLMSLSVVWVLGALLLVWGYLRTRRRHHATLRRWAIEEAPMAEEEAPAAPEPPPRGLEAKLAERPRRSEPGVPTVEHEGRNHTLH